MRVTRTIIAMALVVALASCDEELGQVEVSTVQLQLTTGIASTRAGIDATAFDAGDAIGVFAYAGRSGKESWNIKATTDSKYWNFEKPVSLFSQNTAVYAYYPWNSYATDNHEYGFTVDAITQTNYMVGCDTVVSEDNPKAQIVFRHITSKVSFKITNVDTNAELASAMLNGTKLPLSGKYLFEEGFVSMAANATCWINSKNIIGFGNGRHDVEFLLFPNSANCGATLGLTYKDGTMYSTEFTLPALEENCRYAYNVRVSEDSMKISSPVIAPWNNPSTMDEIVMETHTGHQYVDLGLSVNWATFNVGATVPEEYGDYFAWGETQPKSDYCLATYKYCKGSYDSMTKYCTESYYGYNGYTDGKTTLDPEDDAARAKWGGSWRMPTRAEQDELREKCTWTWTTMNGKNGYKVVSKVNGNSIFLPAAGYRGGSSLYSAGSDGVYWSSSLTAGDSLGAYNLRFISGYVDWYHNYRDYGQSVRPVCPVPVTNISLDKQSVEIMQGGTGTLTVTALYENGATAKIEDAVWFSSNTSVATVDQTGKVRAISVGTCTITAASGSLSATCSVTVKPDPRQFVDLGLSVKWATCNVGASAPEDYGDYFAWGETSPKSSYSWSTYKYCEGSSTTMTKYCTESYYGYNGYTDGKTTLDLSDDAAHANWGGSWRMPTKAEQDELSNTSNCTWTWTTMNGKNGYKVVSKVNGNSIFLPAAGYRGGSSLYSAGSDGDYWSSSSLSTGGSDGAYYINFHSGGFAWYGYGDRYYGRSVRPVCP